MKTRRRKAPQRNLSPQKLAGSYYARKRRTLAEHSFDPSDRAGIEAELGRPIEQMEEGTLRGAQERGDRVALEHKSGGPRVWPIEIDIPMEQAARREAIHRYGAVLIEETDRLHGMSPGAALHALEQPVNSRRPANACRPVAPVMRSRQSHGASHGSSTDRGGDSGDDGSGSSGDGDGDAESSPNLVEAFRACTGRDPKAGRLCACGCGGSIDHLAKQARWLPSHQQRYNEERDRVGELPSLYRRKPLECIGPVGDHTARAERRRALAERSLAETQHQLDLWRERKGFQEMMVSPATEAVTAAADLTAGRPYVSTEATMVDMALWGRPRSWDGFTAEAVAA